MSQQSPPMRIPVRIGVRHWDHLIPLALGDVPDTADLRIVRSEVTPDLWHDASLAAAETSLSRYVRARAAGDDTVVALPVFLMRAFRHRCIIVRRDSDLVTPAQLRGRVVGLTGWPDSGNTWTRAILRADGVGIDDVEWRVGRLTREHPVQDRIGRAPTPTTVRPMVDEAPLADELLTKKLDAVMTPFMPPGFDDADSPYRTLIPDTRAAERDYFRYHGFIPGIHLLAVRREHLDRDPDAGQRLVDAFEAAKRLSLARRRKLLDVTPWQNEEMAQTIATFGDDWLRYGWRHDRHMVAAFQAELVAQQLLAEPVAESTLFPYPFEPSRRDAA